MAVALVVLLVLFLFPSHSTRSLFPTTAEQQSSYHTSWRSRFRAVDRLEGPDLGAHFRVSLLPRNSRPSAASLFFFFPLRLLTYNLVYLGTYSHSITYLPIHYLTVPYLTLRLLRNRTGLHFTSSFAAGFSFTLFAHPVPSHPVHPVGSKHTRIPFH